jgi:putative ABC transport system permease protein
LLSRPSGPLLGAISVIAVGVGLAAMVFALADPALRRLPYADADRLVSISFGMPTPGRPANPDDVPSLASWQARTDLFVGVAAFRDRGWLRVRLSDRMLPLRAVAVSDNLLEVLGLRLESRIAASDPAAACVSSHVATISGGELQPGRSVPIAPEGVLRVRSILPGSFLLPEVNRTEPVDALVNLPAGPVIKIEGTSSQALDLVARVRPDVTPQMVEAALDVSMAPVGRRVSVVPLSMVLNTRLRGLATGALFASVLVVLVCWTNVFSMAVTRGLYRVPEIATRTALGATPSRIVRLLGGEALKVAALGSGSALAVAWLALAVALPALPAQFATLGAPSVTTRVVLFVVFAGVIAGVSWCVASVLAWKLGVKRQGLHIVSRDGGTIRVVRFVLIAGQLAAASVLIVGSALLGRSYLNLMSVDSGLDERTQTLTVAHDPDIPVALRREVVERTLMAFRRAGGVAAAGASAGALLDGRANAGGVMIDGHMARGEDGWPVFPEWTYMVGDYFNAMGLQFVAGGPPGPSNADAAVITESAARQLFGGRTAVGAVLSRDRDFRVVGVVRDVRSRRLSAPPRPGIYVQAGGWNGAQPQTTYVLRVADSSAPSASWERIVRGVDPMAVILDAGSIRERLDRSVRDRTFATLVIGLFALSSLLVAALGLAGVVSYTVVRRTREIAIRLVLGATIESVTSLVVRDALTAATCGVVGGVIASAWLSRALESLLYGIPAADPTTLVLTAASLLGAVLAAATLPGIRAGRIAPASALRSE